ncbi:hypothetical protein Tco_0237981, partial [Tanacetum coccineum]
CIDSFEPMDSEVVKDRAEGCETRAGKEARMKELMNIVPNKEKVAIDAIPLATKPLCIIDWKIIKEGKISQFQIIRADGSFKVKAKHGSTRPEEDYERVLWGDLKTMFEPDVESPVWRTLQEEIKYLDTSS